MTAISAPFCFGQQLRQGQPLPHASGSHHTGWPWFQLLPGGSVLVAGNATSPLVAPVLGRGIRSFYVTHSCLVSQLPHLRAQPSM